MRRLQTKIDERRQPRTNATVSQLVERHLDLVDLEETTLRTYRGYLKHHIVPLIGHVSPGSRRAIRLLAAWGLRDDARRVI